MKTLELSIKGMVCTRCMKVLQDGMESNGVNVLDISLGKILVEYDSSRFPNDHLDNVVRDNGFEIIRDKPTLIAEQTRRLVKDYVYNSESRINLSDYLCQKLKKNYDQISKIYSEVFGRTLERYYLIMKIERTKELIENGELNFSEIAYHIGYHHPSALSRQFKKETGMTLSDYQQLDKWDRIPLDRI